MYEVNGVCRHCAAEVSVIVNHGETFDRCPDCNDAPFAVRKFKGLVYIVSNTNHRGVKIGMTEKTVEQRIKSLNSTGVLGAFKPIAIFPSDRPKIDEIAGTGDSRNFEFEKPDSRA